MKGGGRRRASPAAVPEPEALVTRVVTDVAGVDKEFDYLVPAGVAAAVRVGTQVRIELNGRRVGGWVVAVGVEPPTGLALRPLEKVRGWGPEPELVDLAGWAAWRWAGRRRTFLSTASAPTAVPVLAGATLERADGLRFDRSERVGNDMLLSADLTTCSPA